MKKMIWTLALLLPLVSADTLTINKTPYEQFDCSVDFTPVIGSGGATLLSVTSVNLQTGADSSSTIIAASPAPGVVPGTFAITGASWSNSIETVTIGTHGIKPGQHISVAGASPASYDIFDGTVTAVTPDSVSFANPQNPGAYSSGGNVLANLVSFRVQNGANGEVHQVSVKVTDSTNGQKWEGLITLRILTK